MVENTRVPANEDAVDDARDVKERMGETWSDVFRFYTEYREDIDDRIQDMMSGDADDVGEDLQQIYDELQAIRHGDVEDETDVRSEGAAQLSEQTREQLDRIESAATTVEERTGAIDRKVEELNQR
jgi:methyl-accepting chemotaxis protein